MNADYALISSSCLYSASYHIYTNIIQLLLLLVLLSSSTSFFPHRKNTFTFCVAVVKYTFVLFLPTTFLLTDYNRRNRGEKYEEHSHAGELLATTTRLYYEIKGTFILDPVMFCIESERPRVSNHFLIDMIHRAISKYNNEGFILDAVLFGVLFG